MGKSFIAALLVWVFGVMLHPARSAELSPSAFEAGVTAFRQGDYALALQYFRQLAVDEAPGAALQYNLAVCYYRLGRYQEGAQAFRELLNRPDPAMQQVARYNLGLIAVKREDPVAAAGWFAAAMSGPDEKISDLAVTASGRLRGERSQAKARAWSAFSMFSMGVDDNVGRANEDLGTLAAVSDTFSELLASLDFPLQNRGDDGVRLGGSLFSQAYRNESAYNFLQYRLFLNWDQSPGAWRLRTYGAFSVNEYGSDPFQSRTSLGVRAQTRLSGWLSVFRVRYQWSRLQSENADYDYLQGEQQQLRFSGRGRLGHSGIVLSFTHERNDRQDLAGGTTFASYSPQRNAIRCKLDMPLTGSWDSRLDLQYRISDYPDRYLFSDGSSVRRDDRKFQAGLEIGRTLNRRWRTYLGYEFADNQSSIDRYDYKRSLTMLGLSWSLR